ncbi:hypothetical protein BDDG_13655, partial [Blastomyces dermatitidis ATCC 18188]
SLFMRSVSIRSLRILYFSRSSSHALSVKLMRRIIDFSILFLISFKWQQSSLWPHFLS